MGSFVAFYNYIGFRLAAAPFSLSQSQIGAIFIVYLVGDRRIGDHGPARGLYTRRNVLWISEAIFIAGVLLTLSNSVPVDRRGDGDSDVRILRRAFGREQLGRPARDEQSCARDRAYLFAYYLGLERRRFARRHRLRQFRLDGHRRHGHSLARRRRWSSRWSCCASSFAAQPPAEASLG